MSARRRAAVTLGLLAAFAAGALVPGCATVQPWERGRLSHSCMQLVGRIGDGYLTHVLSIREGSVGGEGASGGGCGCN